MAQISIIRKSHMNIQDQIAADQAKVDQDKATLDADTAILQADQAKLAAAQPHLDILTRVEGELSTLVQDLDADAQAAIAAIVSSVTSGIEEMRALLLG